MILTGFFTGSTSDPRVGNVLTRIGATASNPSGVVNRQLGTCGRHRRHGRLILYLDNSGNNSVHGRFLRILARALRGRKITNTVTSRVYHRPLGCLRDLAPRGRAETRTCLRDLNGPSKSVGNLVGRLETGGPDIVQTIGRLYQRIAKIAPSFRSSVRVRQVLHSLLSEFYSNRSPHFDNVLVLFSRVGCCLRS